MASLRIRIPKDRQPGFAKLLDLEENAFGELIRLLADSPLIYDTDKLVANLMANAKNTPKEDVRDIMDSVFPLYNIQAESELPITDFAEEICRIIEKTPSVDIDIAGDKRELLKDRLSNLLGVQRTGIASKARSLMFEHEHIFQSARIFTDVRPVFGQDPDSPPVAYVIVHMLRIRYYQDRQMKEFFVALDTTDIHKVSDVLERAKVKVRSLQSALQDADLPCIDEE